MENVVSQMLRHKRERLFFYSMIPKSRNPLTLVRGGMRLETTHYRVATTYSAPFCIDR